jgi:hypothetical protein
MDIITGANILVNKTIPNRLRSYVRNHLFSLERREIWSFDLAEKPLPPNDYPLKTINYHLGYKGLLDDMIADEGLEIYESQRKYYAHFFENENKMIIGREGDIIVFYAGVLCGRRTLPKGYFQLNPEEYFVVACFTRRSHRGRCIYPRALRYICEAMLNEGKKKGYIDVATHNLPSVRGIEKAGAIRTDSYYMAVQLYRRYSVIPRGTLGCRFVDC